MTAESHHLTGDNIAVPTLKLLNQTGTERFAATTSWFQNDWQQSSDVAGIIDPAMRPAFEGQ